jgi:hypothetical protein
MNPNNPRNLPPPSIEECPQYPAPPYGQMSGTVYTSFTGKSYVPHENHLVKTRDLVEAILEGAYKPQETLEVEEGFVHPYFEYLRDAWIPLENSGEDLPGTFRKFDEKLGEAWDKDTAFWVSKNKKSYSLTHIRRAPRTSTRSVSVCARLLPLSTPTFAVLTSSGTWAVLTCLKLVVI